MKTRSKSRTAGVATQPGGRKLGRSSVSGPGTSAWNWDTSWYLNRCARQNLRLLFHRRTPTFPYLLPAHPLRGMLHLPPRRPGKLAVSQAQTFLFNLMERCGVQQALCWFLMNNAENAMAACGWSIPPAFATVVRVRCVSSANGAGAPRPNHAR